MTKLAGILLLVAVMAVLLAGFIRARLAAGCRYWAPLNYRCPRRPRPDNSLPSHGDQEDQERADPSFPNKSRAFDSDAVPTSRHR